MFSVRESQTQVKLNTRDQNSRDEVVVSNCFAMDVYKSVRSNDPPSEITASFLSAVVPKRGFRWRTGVMSEHYIYPNQDSEFSEIVMQ